MILLDGHSLNRRIQFRPESQSLTLEERRGQSALTLGDGAPEIQVGDWLLDDTAPGAGIVWRAKTADMNFFRETGTRTIQLEHIVNTLRDGVIFDELKWDSIAASAAISHILGLTGGLWTLGDFEPQDVSWPYKFNACTWMDALETITRTLEDAWWDYDLSSLPFRLHIRSLNSQTDSEMRMSRNITGIRRSVDRSRMYTRFYPIGLNDLHITGDYLSRNEDIYGTCCKIETNQAIDSESELRSWAADRLKRHCEPIVTVTVSGLDLSRDTGEPLDALRLNRVCRVPLPEFGTTIREKVSRLQWPDKIKSPDRMNVVLANEKEDIASIFNQQAAGSEASRSGGGRGAKKKIEEDHAWFVDTSDHVAMVAEAIIGQGPDGVDWSRVAALSVDGYGIHGRVTRAEGYLVTMSGRMDMDEERLSVAFETIGSVRSEFSMTAESLRVAFANDVASVRSELEMSATSLRVAFENDVASVRSEVEQTDRSWRASVEGVVGADGKVTAASIGVAINAEGSNAFINADHIHITGDALLSGHVKVENGIFTVTTAMAVGNTVGNIVTINNGTVQAPTVQVNSGGKLILVGTAQGEHYDIDAASIQNFIKKAEVDGNTLKLYKVTDSTTPSITFSKATAQEAAWGSGSLTVNAYQTNNGIKTRVAQFVSAHELNLNGNGSANFSVEMKTQDTGESTQTVRDSKYIYLYENVNGASSTVVAGENSDGTGAVGSISTRATYNAGKTAGNAEGQAEYKALVRSRFGSASGNYYIEGYESNSGNDITGSSTAYKLGTSGSTTATKVQIQDSTGARIANTAELPVGSLYTEGANSIINAGGPISETANCNAKAINQYVTTLTVNVPQTQDTPWLTPGNGGLTSDGTLGYDTYYRIVRGDGTTPSQVVGGVTHYAVWKTPADRYQAGWDDGYPISYTEMDGGSVSWDSGSIAGRKNIGSISRPSSRSYVKFSITCRGVTRMFYITVN